MGGQQPDFLAQLAGKGKGYGEDPRSKKRKGSETEKNLSRTRGKKDLLVDTTWQQASVAPQPGSNIPNVLTIPSSPTGMPSPPPPPPSSRVPRPILWESGIVSALSTAICAPDRFCDPNFTEATIQELKTIEFNTLKAAALTESLVSMQSRYGKALDELHVFQEEKNKTYEELLKVKEDYKRTNSELISLQQTHAFNTKSLSDFKIMYEDLEKKLKEKEDALKESLSTVESIRKEKEGVEQEAKDARIDVDKSRVALKVGVEGSFNNALAQIKLLNPGLNLNLSGAHYMSYISDGQIVSVSPPSPTVDSVTQVDGEDHEAATADNAVDSHADE